MTRAELRDVLARLSPETRARVSATTLNALLDRTPVRRIARDTYAPYANKWEHEYARYLDVLGVVGEVTGWQYEPDTLVALGGTKYTPDFRVTYPDGATVYVEVKGHLRSRDAVRMREAAAVSPYPIVVLTKRGGCWTELRRYAPGRADE